MTPTTNTASQRAIGTSPAIFSECTRWDSLGRSVVRSRSFIRVGILGRIRFLRLSRESRQHEEPVNGVAFVEFLMCADGDDFAFVEHNDAFAERQSFPRTRQQDRCSPLQKPPQRIVEQEP